MENTEKIKEEKPKKSIVKKSPKLEKKDYVLIKDVNIGGVPKKKGEKVALTEQGRVYFKQQHLIK